MPYRFESLIKDVPDFPVEGVTFKDITPVLASADALAEVVEALVEHWGDAGITKIAGIESRGFIFGAALAHAMEVGLVLVRKPGKLPRKTVRIEYALEYGTDELQLHEDSFEDDDVVLVVDDVLATGGTAAATVQLVRQTGADIAGFACVIELDFLGGRAKLPEDLDVQSLVRVLG